MRMRMMRRFACTFTIWLREDTMRDVCFGLHLILSMKSLEKFDYVGPCVGS